MAYSSGIVIIVYLLCLLCLLSFFRFSFCLFLCFLLTMSSQAHRSYSMMDVVSDFLSSVFSGIAQIYLQASVLTGVVLVLGLYLSHPMLAAGCLLGAGVATISSYHVSFSARERRQGLYGFNAALSGIGLCHEYQANSALLLWIVLSGIATAWVSKRFTEWKVLPALTFQFSIVMLAAFLLGPSTGLVALKSQGSGNLCGSGFFSFSLCSLGQVSFLQPALLAIVLGIALAWHHWRQAAWAASGALYASTAIMLLNHFVSTGLPESAAIGIGVNLVLVMLGLGTFQRSWMEKLAGTTACLLLCLLLYRLALPYFTLPFVFVVWSVLYRDHLHQ